MRGVFETGRFRLPILRPFYYFLMGLMTKHLSPSIVAIKSDDKGLRFPIPFKIESNPAL